MNVLFIVLGSAALLLIAYLTYGKFLSKKVFRLDDKNVLPSHEMKDGVDFVPAKKGFLLGQHFSAIAAAGPINGPILAATLFGWAPALIWVIIGSIFIGGIHDMGSLVASVRNKAASISYVIKKYVSNSAWILFMVFIWITLVYLIVSFTDITASSFVGVFELEDGSRVEGAAIASSSIMYLILPMLMALCMKFGKMKERTALLIFLPLVGVAIWAGKFFPISLPFADIATQQTWWGLLILVYCLMASVAPVWLLLQPRGALGGYFLYAALAFAAIGLVFGNYQVQFPAFLNLNADGSPGENFWTPMFPVLFIIIACGACSGFHALVASGTTSKQLDKETDAKPVAYGAMLLEGLVAVISIACVMILAKDAEIIKKAPNFIYAQGIGSFVELIGIPATVGISFGLMAFTTFVYDTLDVCTRLGRYIVEELTGWKGWKGRFIGTALTAGVPVFFLFSTSADEAGNIIPAWKVFWNTFGASNQLLAALALIGVSVWLYFTRRNSKVYLVALIPAVLMFVMSVWALGLAIYEGWILKQGNPAIPIISVVLIVLSFLVVVITAGSLWKNRNVVLQTSE